MWWRSLRFRLLASIILVVIVAVSLTAFLASRRTIGEFQRYVESGDTVNYRRFAYMLARAYGSASGWDGIQAEIVKLSDLTAQRIVVADRFGRIVGDSEQKLIGERIESAWDGGRDGLEPSAVITVNGLPIGSLFVGPRTGPSEADAAFLSAVNRSLLIGGLGAVLAAVAVTFLLSSRILRPVRNLTAAAQRMETGDLSVRVEVEAEDEIGRLGHAFNAMAGSLASQEQIRRNMVSDVAHELRTPLTNLRGYLEAVRDDIIEPDHTLIDNLYEETMLLSRIVSDLQELALAEAGQLQLVRRPTALTTVVEQAIAMLRPQAEAKGIALVGESSPGLPLVDIDPARVGQVLRNLLNNAVAHTAPGGRISVSAAPEGQMVVVKVHDNGSGIAAEHLPYVFDRFYRADMSRARLTGGAGLGLAIVKQLVQAHGGTVSVSSDPSAGTTFTFTVPVAGAAPTPAA